MKYLYILSFVLVANLAFAQNYAAFQYSINVPMGKTGDFISKPSFRGVTFDYRYEVTPSVMVGFSVGWYTFFEDAGYKTITSKNDQITASGHQYRYLNSVPLLFNVDYYFSESDLRPFVGLGLGTTYNRAEVQMGMYEMEWDPWQFTLAPEAGVAYKLSESVSVLGALRYNVSFKSGDLDTQSFLGLNLGILASLNR